MWLGIFGVFYGAVPGLRQNDIKRLIAYTSVSHMGFVLIGIYSGNMLAMQGLVMQMLAHGFSAAGLFILCGELYERVHTRDLRLMGGLWGKFRYLPAIMMFFCAALLGMPGRATLSGSS
jgi:NADH-quinone oxidoreductase subunit M